MSDQNIIDRIARRLGIVEVRAVLGDGLGNMYDVDGRVFVRYRTSNGLSLPPTVLPPIPANIEHKQGVNVILKWTAGDDLYIFGPDVKASKVAGYNVSTPIDNTKFIGQKAINILLPVATGSLTVGFTAYARIDPATGYAELTGPTADYTSMIPSAGYKRYVTAFLKPDLTIALTGSTQRTLTDADLDEADIVESLAGVDLTWQPIWSIPLQDNPAGITQADVDLGRDLRQFLNLPGGGFDGHSAVVIDQDTIIDGVWLGMEDGHPRIILVSPDHDNAYNWQIDTYTDHQFRWYLPGNLIATLWPDGSFRIDHGPLVLPEIATPPDPDGATQALYFDPTSHHLMAKNGGSARDLETGGSGTDLTGQYIGWSQF